MREKRGIMHNRRVLPNRHAVITFLGLALALLASAGSVLAQRNNQQKPQPAAMPADPDTIALVRLVDAVSMGQQPAPSDIPVNWDSNHFVKGQGGITYIPFTVAVDRAALSAPAAALYIRVVDKNQAAAPAPAAAPSTDKNQK